MIDCVDRQLRKQSREGLRKVNGGEEMNRLEAEFYIKSRHCLASSKHSLSYFSRMNWVCLTRITHIRFQVNRLSE